MGFGALNTATTGLKALGESMGVIGNNLANVNTIGYKEADIVFGDLISTTLVGGTTAYADGSSRISQVGTGVQVLDIQTQFLQGAFEDGDENTDLAINGKGFFGVRDAADGLTYYTRAGNFRFNQDAYLVDPSGFRLQGYQVNRDTGAVGSTPVDIQLPYEEITLDDGSTALVVVNDPRATSEVTMITNLDNTTEETIANANNPFFAMFLQYDATQEYPLGGSEVPAYTSSITIFDADGQSHELTVSYDPVNANMLSNARGGYSYWEYMVTIDPSEDGNANTEGTSAAGVLGFGTITFDGNGIIMGQTLYTLDSGGGAATVKSLSNWTIASFNTDGIPRLSATFLASGGSLDAQPISIDFGLNDLQAAWTGSNVTAGSVGTNTANLPEMTQPNRETSYFTTSYTDGTYTVMDDQDGYTEGYLQNIAVSQDGVLSGYFSNGQQEDLYYLTLYTFISEDGLRREGSNLYSSTDASGAARDGQANEGPRGLILEGTLESSNVDMAEEMVELIVTQRGFSANTKVITTQDSLFSTMLSVKR